MHIGALWIQWRWQNCELEWLIRGPKLLYDLHVVPSWKRWVELKSSKAGHQRNGSTRRERKKKCALCWYGHDCRWGIPRGLPAAHEILWTRTRAMWNRALWVQCRWQNRELEWLVRGLISLYNLCIFPGEKLLQLKSGKAGHLRKRSTRKERKRKRALFWVGGNCRMGIQRALPAALKTLTATRFIINTSYYMLPFGSGDLVHMKALWSQSICMVLFKHKTQNLLTHFKLRSDFNTSRFRDICPQNRFAVLKGRRV